MGGVPLIRQRSPGPLGKDRRVFVHCEYHRAFKSMWAGDEQADAALEWISRDPSLRRTLEVPAASFYRVLETLAAGRRYAPFFR